MAMANRGEGLGGGVRGGSSVGSGIRKTVRKVAEKAAEKESIIRIANTKPVRAATRVVAKQAAKQNVKNNEKAGVAIRKMQSETIAKNSVKVRKGNPSEAKRLNELANARTQDIASGSRAKRESANVKQSKPAKVVKINSAPKKTGK